MKIVRPKGIKEFYDYISIQLGVDPLLVLKHKTELDVVEIQTKDGFPLPNFNYVSNIQHPITKSQRFYTIVVCGIPYVLERKLICMKKNRWMVDESIYSTSVLSKEEFLKLFDKPNRFIVEYASALEKYDARWIDIHKHLDYYCMILAGDIYDKVRSLHTLRFNKTIPMLKDFNFARIKSALEIYLEIQNFLAMLKNTDVPIKLNDLELRDKHGFDKQSFRKRK